MGFHCTPSYEALFIRIIFFKNIRFIFSWIIISLSWYGLLKSKLLFKHDNDFFKHEISMINTLSLMLYCSSLGPSRIFVINLLKF
jgi:hypothetical protein